MKPFTFSFDYYDLQEDKQSNLQKWTKTQIEQKHISN